MDPLQAATLFIALVALGLGAVNSFVQWQTYRRDRADVEVTTNFGRATGDETYVLVTATNRGRQPAAVTGMSLRTTNGTIDLMETVPGETLSPALQPGAYVTMWIRANDVSDTLKTQGGRLTKAVVHGPGGQRWETTKLGSVGKLGG